MATLKQPRPRQFRCVELYSAGYLDNGLGFLLAPLPGARLVHLGVYLDQGVRSESSENNGISHFLEHIAFNPAHFNRTLLRQWSYLEASGVQLEAWTGKEYLSFRLTLPPDLLPKAIAFVRSLLVPGRIRNASVERERAIILEEIARKKATPEFAFDLLESALFAPPYGRPVLGDPRVVAQLSAKELRNWARKTFNASRTRLIISGAVREWAEKALMHFEDYPGGLVLQESPRVEVLPRFVAIPGRRPRVRLLLGFPAPVIDDPDRPAVEVLAHLVGGGLGSRLFAKIRQRDGLAYEVGGGSLHYRFLGYVYFYIELSRENLSRGLNGVLDALREIRSSPPSADELRRAKEGVALQRLREAETPGVLRRLGLFWMAGGLYFPSEEVKAYHRVREEDVSQMADRYLCAKQMALVGIGATEEEMEGLMEVIR